MAPNLKSDSTFAFCAPKNPHLPDFNNLTANLHFGTLALHLIPLCATVCHRQKFFITTFSKFSVALCEFSVAVGIGWTAPTIKQLKNSDGQFSLTTEECSWIASLPELFRAVGTVLVFLIADVVGRKKLYFLCPILLIVSWLMVLLVNQSVWALYIGRGIFGLANGINDASGFIYLVENSSPRLRGNFVSIYLSFYTFGLLVAYSFSAYLPYTVVILINLLIQFPLMLSMILMKESVQFLILRGRYEEAENTFYWLRGSASSDTKLEYQDMVANIPQKLRCSSLGRIFSSKADRRSLITVVLNNVLVTTSGVRTISSFTTTIFSQSVSISAEHLTILYGLLSFINMTISSLFIERFNRRTILIAGLLGIGAILSLVSALYYWQENVFHIPHFGWLVFSGIMIYFSFQNLAVSPVVNTCGELLSQNVRPLGSFLSFSGGAIVTFATSFAFLPIAETYGMYFNFLFFSLASLIAAFYVYLCLPEAKGKSLVEIQKMFEK